MALANEQAHELLWMEEADAWFEYLDSVRGQSAVRYLEVEPWAWARLAQTLREAGPRPRLDLEVPDGALAAHGVEVLEPGVRLLHPEELMGLLVRQGHPSPPVVSGTIGPGPDGAGSRNV